MLNTRQKVLRNFCYGTLPIEKMKDGPKPFRLLGEEIVLLSSEPGTGRSSRRIAQFSNRPIPTRIVDMSRKLEMHMPSDRPGMLMRQRLNALLVAHGEHEVPR